MILAANVVRVVHIAFAALIFWGPFSGQDALVVFDFLVIPLLWAHWISSDDTCILTLLEQRLRGCQKSDSFFNSLVSGVYKIQDRTARLVCWWTSIAIWTACALKVAARPGMVRDFFRAGWT